MYMPHLIPTIGFVRHLSPMADSEGAFADQNRSKALGRRCCFVATTASFQKDDRTGPGQDQDPETERCLIMVISAPRQTSDEGAERKDCK